MLDDERTTSTTDQTDRPTATQSEPSATPPPKRTRRRAASRPAGPPAEAPAAPTGAAATTEAPRRQRTTKITMTDAQAQAADAAAPAAAKAASKPAAKAAAKTTAKTTKAAAKSPEKTSAKTASKTTAKKTSKAAAGALETTAETATSDKPKRSRKKATAAPAFSAEPETAPADVAAGVPATTALFQPPEPVTAPRRRTAKKAASTAPDLPDADDTESAELNSDAAGEEGGEGAAEGGRRRRRRGGRGRRGRSRTGEGESAGEDTDTDERADEPADQREQAADSGADADDEGTGTTRRRRRRRRRGGGSGEGDEPGDDPARTVVHVRQPRKKASDADGSGISGVKGSTRLEAKKQRRREGREQGRRRPPVLSEAEFLARRESVDRVMVVRQVEDRTQIGVLEDDVLVEHYIARESTASMAGSVYLGRVQNVLPSMEAAFVDIGRGRNAVLYAGEVNWDAAGLDGQPRRIEHAMKSGDAVLVQVTKDPIGHKGARLTAQVSLPGRYLVYVPDGSMTGISRKLPDQERTRLKGILKRVVPDDAGVIVRTAAEGASEEELQRDVSRLAAQWEEITKKAKTAQAPAVLYEEADLTVRVIRDIFNEDFASLVVSGDGAWQTIEGYLTHVAPDLVPRLSKWTEPGDAFAAHRIDEQLAKALDRKVWLPSGGYLIFDPTEAMTVVDVNTGKFTGSGGNLEETVTRNNIEAAEEIVRQLRLRDIGGIIVVDFIDMVLEGNRELVLRRLLEALGRDRTKHQVAEVTSLGLVQMTRKRVGQGLLDAFSTPCEACNGRGRHVHADPVEPKGGGRGDAKSAPAKPARRKRGAAKAEEAEREAAAAAAVASIAKASALVEVEAPEELVAPSV